MDMSSRADSKGADLVSKAAAMAAASALQQSKLQKEGKGLALPIGLAAAGAAAIGLFIHRKLKGIGNGNKSQAVTGALQRFCPPHNCRGSSDIFVVLIKLEGIATLKRLCWKST